MAGHQEVAGRVVAVAAGDLAGWGGFGTVLAGLLALAAGSGWTAALLLICVGSLLTAAACWSAGQSRSASQSRSAPTAIAGAEPRTSNGAEEPPVTA